MQQKRVNVEMRLVRGSDVLFVHEKHGDSAGGLTWENDMNHHDNI